MSSTDDGAPNLAADACTARIGTAHTTRMAHSGAQRTAMALRIIRHIALIRSTTPSTCARQSVSCRDDDDRPIRLHYNVCNTRRCKSANRLSRESDLVSSSPRPSLRTSLYTHLYLPCLPACLQRTYMALVGRYHNNHRCRLCLRRMEGEPRDRDPAADIVYDAPACSMD